MCISGSVDCCYKKTEKSLRKRLDSGTECKQRNKYVKRLQPKKTCYSLQWGQASASSHRDKGETNDYFCYMPPPDDCN